jgi:hypothetical protein
LNERHTIPVPTCQGDKEPASRSLPVERTAKRIPQTASAAIAQEKWRPQSSTRRRVCDPAVPDALLQIAEEQQTPFFRIPKNDLRARSRMN